MFDHIFGGQLLAQALVAAGATVSTGDVSSLHALFVTAGAPGHDLELAVDRVRDGRALTTRRVTITQQGRTVLEALVSFHATIAGPDVGDPMPAAAEPQDVPLVQHWAAASEHSRGWIDRPPPIEMRIAEPLRFMGGSTGVGPRSHWMRLPRAIGDDALLHAALLAYASDFFLLDMLFRAHPAASGRLNGFSLDHAVWFHRPARFDTWHLHTQEAVALVGDRGLATGLLHDIDGRLVATAAQEIVVRPMGAS
jgi:acyl-CoA thioesterase-2